MVDCIRPEKHVDAEYKYENLRSIVYKAYPPSEMEAEILNQQLDELDRLRKNPTSNRCEADAIKHHMALEMEVINEFTGTGRSVHKFIEPVLSHLAFLNQSHSEALQKSKVENGAIVFEDGR